MKTFKRLISFLLVLVMMCAFAIPSYAATLDFSLIPNFEGKTLIVTGTSDPGRMLTFYVTDKGISASAMTFTNNFYALHQETVKNDGSFDVTMKLPEEMAEGTYKLIIGGLGASVAEADRSSEFDYMKADGKAYILEAESASGLDKWEVKSDSLASGGTYLSLFEENIDYTTSDAKITFTFDAEEAMEYDIFALVSNTAGHTSTHTFSVNNDKKTSSISWIGEQVYSGQFTRSNHQEPMYWAKIRSNQPIGKGTATIVYEPNEASLFAGRILAAIDAVYVVPSSWDWEPYATTTPVNENKLNILLKSAELKDSTTERGGTVKVVMKMRTPAKLTYNVPVWAEMRYKGELVARQRTTTNVPMNMWPVNSDITNQLNITVPTVAPDGEYEVYCGLGSHGKFANTDESECLVGTVTIGEIDEPNPDVLKISSVKATQNGKTLDVSYTLSEAADVETAKAFIRFWDGETLWGVAETEEKIDVSTVDKAIDATFCMPSGMPSGTYIAELGFYNVNGTRTIGEMEIVSDKKNDYKPLSNGIYKSQKTGQHHFWYINQAGAAIWDGEPFIPMGGMYCPNILAGYSFTDPSRNIAEWTEDMREIDILVRNGVTDLYLNSSIKGSPTWVWEYVLDYLDKRGIRYGLQTNGGSGYTEQDAFYVCSSAGQIASSSFFTISAGEREVTLNKTLSVIGDSTPKYALYSLVSSSKVVDAGIAEMTKGSGSGNYNFKATVNIPSSGYYTAYFTPIVNKGTGFVNFWKYGEQMLDHAAKFANKVSIGDGVRNIIDPATNESGYYNQYANERPYDDTYNALYKNWLTKKYVTVGNLNDAWVTSGIESFAQASRIIPVYTSSGDNYKIYGYDSNEDALFEFDGRTTQMWLDFIEFRDSAAAEFYNELADAYKTKLDVPVVIKSVYFHMENFRNQRSAGGIDGLGSESYAVAEGVGDKHMVAYGLTNQFAKTGWSIVTETNVEENVTGKHNAAYEKDASGNVTGIKNPAQLGYGTKERMHTNFDHLFDSGAKGIYDFVLSARHSPTIQQAYTYVYFYDHYRDLIWEDAKYDLDHFAWFNEYKEKIAAKTEEIVNKQIDKNVIYFTPAAAYTNMGGPNRFNAAHLADHKWLNYSYKTTINGKKFGILLTDDPNVNTQYIAGAFENGPVSTKQGVAFGNMLDTMPEDKIAIYLGFRNDLGTVPQVDKYFTNQFTKNSAGVKVQVLDPGATGEVIWSTSDGKPWAIRDGNFWIIAAEDCITGHYENLNVDYLNNIGIFMDEADIVMQDFEFVDNEGVTIDKVTQADATLNVRIKNNTEEEIDAVMYAASYDNGGNLLSVSKKTRTLFNGVNYIETDLGLSGDEGFARGFIWDKDMNPLIEDVLEIKK